MLTKEQENNKKLNEELKRLQELCEKNKIEYKKPITPPTLPEIKK